jgi:hypothetical protein
LDKKPNLEQEVNYLKWILLGAIAAFGVALTPAVASAQEATLDGTPSECRDAAGAFVIDWTLDVTDATIPGLELDGFGDATDDGNVENGVLTVDDGGFATPLTLGDFGLASGAGIADTGSATAQTAYDGSVEPNAVISTSGTVQWSLTGDAILVEEDPIVSNDVARPDYCVETACLNGDYTGQAVNVLTDTGDCGPVRLCVDGQSMTVTEYDANNLSGATDGSCVPSDTTPGRTTDSSTPPPPPPSPTQMCTVDGVNYLIVEHPLLCSGKHQHLEIEQLP